MTPITKNIRVVDESGKEYEATYPKRAKGLVKNGRARFVDETTICLSQTPAKLRPPNKNLEDKDMSTNQDKSIEINDKVSAALQNDSDTDVGEIVRQAVDAEAAKISKFEEAAGKADANAELYDKLAADAEAAFQGNPLSDPRSEQPLAIDYVLARIDKIMDDTAYLKSTLEALVKLPPAAGPGDIAGAAQAEAIGSVVKCRETTNQQTLRLLEKMYDDLKNEQKSLQEKGLDLLGRAFNNSTLSQEEKELLVSSLDEIRHLSSNEIPVLSKFESVKEYVQDLPPIQMENFLRAMAGVPQNENSAPGTPLKQIRQILDEVKSTAWNEVPDEIRNAIAEGITAQLSRNW